MSQLQQIDVHVSAIRQLTPRIKQFHLRAHDGTILPACSAGSHIIVSAPDNAVALHHAYTITNPAATPIEYRIAVQREELSRGGSHYLHDVVTVGQCLRITPPKNLFPLQAIAAPVVLIAAGIGITPIYAFVQQLNASGESFIVHYSYRGNENAAFRAELRSMCSRDNLHLYDSRSEHKLNVDAVIDGLPSNAQVYVCGPNRMIDAVQAAMQQRGFSAAQFHCERFVIADQVSQGFTVIMAKSGQQVVVPPEQSILQALQQAGRRDLASLCCDGVCGTCELPLLEGEAEHRDQYLTDSEKVAQKAILICVSRAKSARLVLDI